MNRESAPFLIVFILLLQGPESLSDLVVTFHEIRDPVDFYFIQYLVNDLRLIPPGASRPFMLSQIPS